MNSLGHLVGYAAGTLCLAVVFFFGLVSTVRSGYRGYDIGDGGEVLICNMFCALGLGGAVYFFVVVGGLLN